MAFPVKRMLKKELEFFGMRNCQGELPAGKVTVEFEFQIGTPVESTWKVVKFGALAVWKGSESLLAIIMVAIPRPAPLSW